MLMFLTFLACGDKEEDTSALESEQTTKETTEETGTSEE